MTDRAYYEVLGIHSDATAPEIKEAYYRLATAFYAEEVARKKEATGPQSVRRRNTSCCAGAAIEKEAAGSANSGSPQKKDDSDESTTVVIKDLASMRGQDLTDRLVQIEIAYEILSDGARRQIYDTYGELGVLQLGSAPSGVSDVVRFVGAQFILLGVLTLVAIGLSSIVIFLVFVARKVDGEIDWSWYSVFVPLYVVGVVLGTISLFAFLGVIGAITIGSKFNFEGLPKPPIDLLKILFDWSAAVFTMGWVAFTATISYGLQQREDAIHGRGVLEYHTNWWLYFIPCIISEGVLFLSTLVGFPRLQNTLLRRGVAKASTFDIRVLVFLDLVVKASRVVGIFLICGKISAHSDTRMARASWWVILIPYYCMFIFMVLDAVYLALLRRHSSTMVTGGWQQAQVAEVLPRNGGQRKELLHAKSQSSFFYGANGPPFEERVNAPPERDDECHELSTSERRGHDCRNSSNTASNSVPTHFFSVVPSRDDESKVRQPTEADVFEDSWGLERAGEYEHSPVTIHVSLREQKEKLREDSAHYPSVWGACWSATLFAGLPFATLVMIAAKLEASPSPSSSPLSLHHCFIPLYVMFSCSMCAALCVGCFLVASAHTMEDDIHAMEGHASRVFKDREEAVLREQNTCTENSGDLSMGAHA